MKEIIALMAVFGLVAALLTLNFLVSVLPQMSSSGENLFGYSVQSTLSYFAVPAVFLLCLAFLAFLVFLLRIKQ